MCESPLPHRSPPPLSPPPLSPPSHTPSPPPSIIPLFSYIVVFCNNVVLIFSTTMQHSFSFSFTNYLVSPFPFPSFTSSPSPLTSYFSSFFFFFLSSIISYCFYHLSSHIVGMSFFRFLYYSLHFQ